MVSALARIRGGGTERGRKGSDDRRGGEKGGGEEGEREKARRGRGGGGQGEEEGRGYTVITKGNNH
jgi:hypothetical protein